MFPSFRKDLKYPGRFIKLKACKIREHGEEGIERDNRKKDRYNVYDDTQLDLFTPYNKPVYQIVFQDDLPTLAIDIISQITNKFYCYQGDLSNKPEFAL